MERILLILQCFDWLAAFHLELLQAILFIAVQLSAPVLLATCFKYYSRGLPMAFFCILLVQGCLLQTCYARLHALSMNGVLFFVIFLLLPFEKLHLRFSICPFHI
jgi:hypothetical protein